ncbi:MAG: transposase DNA-binding-containing protein [Nostoc sp.]|uniref:transposase DNA-binding-containing protein n=1 Tax=Nostoc sp. TaxID=1180 RepID=UPI002FF06BA0
MRNAGVAANPQASLPDIMQGGNEIRAAYRLFAEEDVKHQALIEPHIAATLHGITSSVPELNHLRSQLNLD